MKIAVFSRSFLPPTRAHAWVVRKLAELYPKVLVRPRGRYRDDELTCVTPAQREEMIRLALGSIDPRRVTIDLSDIDRPFMPMSDLYASLVGSGFDPVIIVGSGYVLNGDVGSSDIQNKWKDGRRLWEEACFRVVSRMDGCAVENYPPNTDGFVLECPIDASATRVREKYADGETAEAEHLLSPNIAAYVRRHNLFRQADLSA